MTGPRGLGANVYKLPCSTVVKRWKQAEERQAAGKKTWRFGGKSIPKFFAEYDARYRECMGLAAEDSGVLSTLEDLDDEVAKSEQELEQSMVDAKAATTRIVLGLVVVTIIVVLGMVGWAYARG